MVNIAIKQVNIVNKPAKSEVKSCISFTEPRLGFIQLLHQRMMEDLYEYLIIFASIKNGRHSLFLADITCCSDIL